MVSITGGIKDLVIPKALQAGDKVGITCPAGFMEAGRIQDCANTLKQWGLELVEGATCNSQSTNYFSGTDTERCEDLQQMLNDPSIKAIICGRGGYGISRIIDQLDFELFKKHPKWIVGFSDITLLHNHILQNCGIATIHGPMASAFQSVPTNAIQPGENSKNPATIFRLLPGTASQEARNISILALKNTLFQSNYTYIVASNAFNKTGQCQAPIIGGNLSLLVHAIGTNSDTSWDNKILFIEDIGEYYYAVDRMLVQLLRSGKLNHLAGLIIGGFSDMKDTSRPFGQSLHALFQAHLQSFNYPVCYHFPISHDDANLAIKCGLLHELSINESEVSLMCL